MIMMATMSLFVINSLNKFSLTSSFTNIVTTYSGRLLPVRLQLFYIGMPTHSIYEDKVP